MKFHEWFQKQLLRREWSQADFVRRANIGPSTVHSWYHGTRIPDPPSCDLIGDVLGVAYAEVMQVAGHLPTDRPLSVDDSRVLLHALIDRVNWQDDPTRAQTVEGVLRLYFEADQTAQRQARAAADQPPASPEVGSS